MQFLDWKQTGFLNWNYTFFHVSGHSVAGSSSMMLSSSSRNTPEPLIPSFLHPNGHLQPLSPKMAILETAAPMVRKEKISPCHHIYWNDWSMENNPVIVIRNQNRIAIGKKYALKIYDQFVLNTSCLWGSNRSSIMGRIFIFCK